MNLDKYIHVDKQIMGHKFNTLIGKLTKVANTPRFSVECYEQLFT